MSMRCGKYTFVERAWYSLVNPGMDPMQLCRLEKSRMYLTARPDPIVAPCSMRKAAAAGLKRFLVVPTARYNLLQVHACPPRQYKKYDVNRNVNVSGAPPCPGIRNSFENSGRFWS
jgi:hypothetical protein